MQNLDLIFLLAAFFVFPVFLGWSARFMPSAYRGVFAGSSVVAPLLSAFFIARRAVADFGLGDPHGAWVPLVFAGLGSIVGWVVFSRMGSLARDLTTESGHLRSLRVELLKEITKRDKKIVELSKLAERAHDVAERARVDAFVKINDLAERCGGLMSDIWNLRGRLDALRVEFRKFAATHRTSTRLTDIDGSVSRASGNVWQGRVAKVIDEVVKRVGDLRLDVYYGKGEPDFVFRRGKKNETVAVGACKALSLPYRTTKRVVRQRTIRKNDIMTEYEFALRHGVPLFIVVVSQKTCMLWYHVVPHPAKFSRVTTPTWLADPNSSASEANRNAFHDFVLSLQEKDR